MPEEWRNSVQIYIFKNMCDIQLDLVLYIQGQKGDQYNTMKRRDRVVERRLRSELTFSEQQYQYGFMPGKSTTDALFALRLLMEKHRECLNECLWNCRKLVTRCQYKSCCIA